MLSETFEFKSLKPTRLLTCRLVFLLIMRISSEFLFVLRLRRILIRDRPEAAIVWVEHLRVQQEDAVGDGRKH